MILATSDPLILSLTWSGLVCAAPAYALLIRRRAASEPTPNGEEDGAVLRHLVQVLVINDQANATDAVGLPT
jgi:hypothetical protein